MPPHARPQDWARVVAVFVAGTTWQLKEFPFKARRFGLSFCTAPLCPLVFSRLLAQTSGQGASEGNLLETFAAVGGFLVRFDCDPVPDFARKVRQTNCGLRSELARKSERTYLRFPVGRAAAGAGQALPSWRPGRVFLVGGLLAWKVGLGLGRTLTASRTSHPGCVESFWAALDASLAARRSTLAY